MTDKRFDITVSNDNTVRLIDQKESNDLISIGFKNIVMQQIVVTRYNISVT